MDPDDLSSKTDRSVSPPEWTDDPVIVSVSEPTSVSAPSSPQRVRRRSPLFRRRVRLSVLLFIATCLSTFWVGAFNFPFIPHPDIIKFVRAATLHYGWAKILTDGLSYSVPVMLILLAHEMGHYLQARRYGVPATLPYFIPLPLPPLGTMGAVIVQGAGYANRKALFDIAISGPLAGLVLAIPVMYFGLQNAYIVRLDPQTETLLFGDPLILQWMTEWILRPLGENEQVVLNPLLMAGWVGVFITALNLIPIGQLDGGHILYTLIGRKAHWVAIGLLATSLAYMILSQYPAYILMVILLIFMGPLHPPTTNDRARLGTGRLVLGWLTLAFVIIGFTPTPFMHKTPEPAAEERLLDDGLPEGLGWMSPNSAVITNAGNNMARSREYAAADANSRPHRPTWASTTRMEHDR